MTLYDFSREINNLNKLKRYEEALHYFKENKHQFDSEEIADNPFVIGSILSSLRKTGQAKYIDTFLKQYQIQINESTQDMILTAYGWGLYEMVKSGQYTKQMILQVLKYPIYLLFLRESVYSYSVISNLFSLGLKKAKEHTNQDFLFTNDYCDLFDPDKLSSEPNVFEFDGKRTESASDSEKWYSEKSKALFELKKFEMCYELSNKALHTIKKFHSNNNVWFTRRMALSQKELGNLDVAIEKLTEVYRDKKEWFIQKEIAELYFEKGEIESAAKNCIEALNTRTPVEFKVGLILLMGKILKSRGETLLTQKHFLLDKMIREDKGWKVSDEVLYETGSIEGGVIRKDLQRELINYWRKQIPKEKIYIGVVKKILHDNQKGKDGFIVSEGEDFYFTLPSHVKWAGSVQKGIQVEFEIFDLPDGRQKARILKITQTADKLKLFQ